jgi:hypothetical protein
MKRIDPLVRRRDLTQLAVNQSLGRTYKLATLDCGKLIGRHLRKFGYTVELPKVGAYSTPAGALKWLKTRRFESLEARLDAIGLVRIAPARAMTGDIMALDSTDALAALVIWLGHGQALGFHESSDKCVLLAPSSFRGAWSVLP